MSRARDDARRDRRRQFALYDGEALVGVDVLTESDGCWTEYRLPNYSDARFLADEWRRVWSRFNSADHVPGSHVLGDLFPIHGQQR